MDQTRAAGTTGGIDLIRGAGSAPPRLDATLDTVFRGLVPPAGAVAAALCDAGTREVLAGWNVEGAAAARLATAAGSHERREAAGPSSDPLPIEPIPTLDGRWAGAVRVLPLEAAGPVRFELLLFFEPGGGGAGPQAEAAAELAQVVTRLVEREIFAEEARRAREARDHFLVALHHELRTPATALLLESDLLQSGLLGSLPPRLQSALARIDGRVGEVVRVVQRVLDLGELEAAGATPRSDLVDPREAIVALARHAEPAAEAKGISISLFFPRHLPVVQTDGERFRRVLLYLLANAVKYVERGHIQIRVERVSGPGGSAGGAALVVRVVDTGCGIPPDQLERIFEPFAQVDEGARTDSRRRGVGLGLSIARKLARSIGGDVVVESEPGKGTTASFSLPLGPG
jgi:signal transduction histidine kinase